jgi:hypothetical protein
VAAGSVLSICQILVPIPIRINFGVEARRVPEPEARRVSEPEGLAGE